MAGPEPMLNLDRIVVHAYRCLMIGCELQWNQQIFVSHERCPVCWGASEYLGQVKRDVPSKIACNYG